MNHESSSINHQASGTKRQSIMHQACGEGNLSLRCFYSASLEASLTAYGEAWASPARSRIWRQAEFGDLERQHDPISQNYLHNKRHFFGIYADRHEQMLFVSSSSILPFDHNTSRTSELLHKAHHDASGKERHSKCECGSSRACWRGCSQLQSSMCLLSDHDSARTILCIISVARFPKVGAATIAIDSISFRSVGSAILEDQAMC